MFKKFFERLADKVSDSLPSCEKCKLAIHVVSIINPKKHFKDLNNDLHRNNLTCRTLCGTWQPKGMPEWSPEELESMIPPILPEVLEFQKVMSDAGIIHDNCLTAFGTIIAFAERPDQFGYIAGFLKSEKIVCPTCYEIFYEIATGYERLVNSVKERIYH